MNRVSSILLAAALFALTGCQASSGGHNSAGTSTTATTKSTATPAAGAATTTPAAAQTVTLPDGLKYQDVKVGDGAIAENGLEASVHYTGWLTDADGNPTGSPFDSSRDRGQPFTFRIGAGQVIAGWDEGVKGMRVGGRRKLTIPAALGYGDRGAGGVIPPNATLSFDVELLGLR